MLALHELGSWDVPDTKHHPHREHESGDGFDHLGLSLLCFKFV